MAKGNNDKGLKKEKNDEPTKNETSAPKKKPLEQVHFIILFVTLCIGIGWVTSYHIRINPLQSEIDKQKTQLEKLTKQKHEYRLAIEELETLTRQKNECQEIIKGLRIRLRDIDSSLDQGTKVRLTKGTTGTVDIMEESVTLELVESSQTTGSAIVKVVGSGEILNIDVSNREKRFELRDRTYILVLLELEDNSVKLGMELL